MHFQPVLVPFSPLLIQLQLSVAFQKDSVVQRLEGGTIYIKK